MYTSKLLDDVVERVAGTLAGTLHVQSPIPLPGALLSHIWARIDAVPP